MTRNVEIDACSVHGGLSEMLESRHAFANERVA